MGWIYSFDGEADIQPAFYHHKDDSTRCPAHGPIDLPRSRQARQEIVQAVELAFKRTGKVQHRTFQPVPHTVVSSGEEVSWQFEAVLSNTSRLLAKILDGYSGDLPSDDQQVDFGIKCNELGARLARSMTAAIEAVVAVQGSGPPHFWSGEQVATIRSLTLQAKADWEVLHRLMFPHHREP